MAPSLHGWPLTAAAWISETIGNWTGLNAYLVRDSFLFELRDRKEFVRYAPTYFPLQDGIQGDRTAEPSPDNFLSTIQEDSLRSLVDTVVAPSNLHSTIDYHRAYLEGRITPLEVRDFASRE